MSQTRNTEEMIKSAKQRTINTKNIVLQTIDEMLSEGLPITFSSVSQRSGVTRKFMYNNEDIKMLINKYSKSKNRRKNQSSDSKDVIISNKNKRISDLEKRVRELEVDSGYREKYRQACKERDMYKKLSEENITW